MKFRDCGAHENMPNEVWGTKRSDRGLLTVSGPYGAGKDTILNSILRSYPNSLLHRVRTLTTRPSSSDADPSYSTVSPEEFERRTLVGRWLVNQQFSGAVSYATSVDEIQEEIKAGRICLHTVFAGPAGVGRMREVFGKQLLALGVLASEGGVEEQLAVLSDRLQGRTRDDEEGLRIRLSHQLDPIKYVLDNPLVDSVDGPMHVFDEIIVNDDRERAMKTARRLFAEGFFNKEE